MRKKLYTFLSSVRLTIFLFFAIAATSIIGTLVQQGVSPERYEAVFGEKLLPVLTFFDVFDMYHSWWFSLLLLLLSVNLAACTFRRVPSVIRLAFRKRPLTDDAPFTSSPIRRRFYSRSDRENLERRISSFLVSLAGVPIRAEKGDASYFFAEKGRFSRFGMTLVHCSVLVILGGGLVGAVWGFSGQMTLVEGDRSDTVTLFGGKGTIDLGFDVMCEKFTVSYYESGLPREYKTDLAILNNGEAVLNETIRVNHPLTHEGFKFSQATFGVAGGYNFRINVVDEDTNEESTLNLNVMKKKYLPGGDTALAVARFDPHFMGRVPAVLGVLISPDREHDIFWMPKDMTVRKGSRSFTLLG
ncbi:MAG TPA: hypothetical protein ENN35_06300, partial [Deltaproteobacteria bacterium]|nr:hypothetical protein [Deltaproteobacteria bacterium]